MRKLVVSSVGITASQARELNAVFGFEGSDVGEVDDGLDVGEGVVGSLDSEEEADELNAMFGL